MNIENLTDTPSTAADVLIFETNMAGFEAQVVHASMDKPVIAYFTAPWCGPCRQLSPTLEAAVQEAGGKVLLAKINLDENQELAAMLRIQSVPTVYGFFQGRPLDAFQGAVPPQHVKAFIDKLLEASRLAHPDALDVPVVLEEAAKALTAGDIKSAHSLYTQILQQDQNNAPAYAGLIRIFLAAGQPEKAQMLIDNASEDIQKERAFRDACTAFELMQAQPSGNAGDLMSRLADDENDHQARFDLAMIQFAGSDKAQALENLLEILRRDRTWNDEAARKQLLKCFEALGASDPLTQNARRKLSAILFS